MNRPTEPIPPEAALRFLLDRVDYERSHQAPAEIKLGRMRRLLARLGNPQDRLAIVHIAGTKGKGSTAAMLGAMLTAAGYRTGVFTSPHLHRIEERIAVDGLPCTRDELIQLINQVHPAVAAMDAQQADERPTFFEIITALALVHFASLPVDAAVLEVGLGGRLDSTNVCRPRVSIITSISLDHTQQLGETVEAIAQEKAGIIKPGVPVVSGVTADPARAVIRETCQRLNCRLVELGEDFQVVYVPAEHLEANSAAGAFDYSSPARRYQRVVLALPGRHQAANAAVALAALELFGLPAPEEAVRRALSGLAWPARVEVVRRHPVVVVDAAHNVASIEALLATLQESLTARRRWLVFAGTRDKDVPGMLARLVPTFDEIFVTRYSNNPRAIPPEELAAVVAGLGRTARCFARSQEALEQALAAADRDDLICVTGSFFIAAEARETLLAS